MKTPASYPAFSPSACRGGHFAFRIFLLATLLAWLPGSIAWAIIPSQTAEYLGPGNGVRFRVYAPNASSVAVAGDFNAWNATANPLTKGNNNVWYTTVPTAERYQHYKYVLNGTLWQKDPNSLRVEHSGGAGNSIIADLGHYQWSDNEANWQSGAHVPPITATVIYQLHLKTFLYRNDGIPYAHSQAFNQFVEHKLDYLQDLGVNCILLMPIHEFPGDTSWGYNPALWFAPESSYGTPYDVQRFVDECHKRGIAVTLDVVYNHAGPDDIPHYWNFDGGNVHSIGGNGNYFYTDWRGRTPWGDTNPDFGSLHVRGTLVENAKMWILDYHMDGLRVDSTVTIRKDKDDGYDWDGADNPDGWSFLQYLNNELRPLKGSRTMMIAEDIASNSWITKNTNEGGAGFMAQWQPSPINNVVTQWDDNYRDMYEVAHAVGHTIGVNYGLHEIVKYHSSHDNVDRRNNHWRLPNRIGDPAQWYSKKRSKLAQAIILTAPGTPMIFMGDEFYATGQWDDDPDHALDWAQLEANRDYWEYNRALIRLKRTRPAMHTNNLEVPVIDNDMKIIAYKRWNDQGDVIVFVYNFRAVEQTRSIPFPEDGVWREIINSDSAFYGGDNVGNGGSVTVSGGLANVRLGSYSMIAFSMRQDSYPPGVVSTPNPADGAINAAPGASLLWRAASEAAGYNVYFAPTRSAVENATPESPEFKGYITQTEYKPAAMDIFTTYYWRVDSVNSIGVTRGPVWTFTTSGGDSAGEGRALWSPAAPVAGSPVTVRYYATGGPLESAATMVLHWGHSVWQDVADIPMTNVGTDIWSVTVNLPSAATQLDFVFTTNPSGGQWDNNNGADWHVNVLPETPRASWTPDPPVAGQPMSITYQASPGPLATATQIYLHRGYNSWAATTIVHLPMTDQGSGVWGLTFTLPQEVDQVDFVFADGLEGAPGILWDNNNGYDWHVPVSGGGVPQWGLSTPQLLPVTYQGTDPTSWTFQLWNAGMGTLDWTLAKRDDGSGTNWFTLSTAAGSSTGTLDRTTVQVTFQVDGMTTGTHTASIVATEASGSIDPAVITITLTIRSLNLLVITPDSMQFPWVAGTTQQTLWVRNGVAQAMPFQAHVVDPEANPWIQVQPASGENGGPAYPMTPITISVNNTGLPRQAHTAEIEVTAPNTRNSPRRVPVLLVPGQGENLWLIR